MSKPDFAIIGLICALSAIPSAWALPAETESNVEALVELRKAPPALEREEQAREMREDLQMDDRARRVDEQVLRGICRDC